MDFFGGKYRSFIAFLAIFILFFLLELNFVGFTIREKITIGSTLDFSWFSDLIERAIHGYILGRDFTFTYGPLFQFIYASPSLVFHIPSYLSVALSPVISFILIFFVIVYIAKFLSNTPIEQIEYILISFIMLGLLTAPDTDTVKMLLPLAYACFLSSLIIEKRTYLRLLIASLLPTAFGLYAYNLFITCFVMAIFFMVGYYLFVFFRTRWSYFVAFGLFKKLVKKYSGNKSEAYSARASFLLLIPFILFFHIIFSLLFSHNLTYILNSLDAVKNFRYVLDIPWTRDRSNILLLFPLALLVIIYYLITERRMDLTVKYKLFVFILAALLELIYAVSRSDAGHLLFAVYPSILAFFSALFILSKGKRNILLIGILFYLLVPFKPTFYNNFSAKNIMTVFEAISSKPDFFTIFRLPENYYFTRKEIMELRSIIRENRHSVYFYPYDSFLLNTEHTTYNSFALGLYTYSDSLVEENTVKGLAWNPPAVIILAVDTKGALPLDDIPNFTRNPLVASWMIRNYIVTKATVKYLILQYHPQKRLDRGLDTCPIQLLMVDLNNKETIPEKLLSLLKPPVYYFGPIRLPYSPWVKDYMLFQGIYSSGGVKSFFETPSHPLTGKIFQDKLMITRVSPFLGKKEFKQFEKNEFFVSCVHI